jgi:hypothetical protein
MGPRNLDKETLLSESAYAQYCKRMKRHLPKGVLTLAEAKQTNDIKILYSRHYGIVFFTDDYTLGARSLYDFSRQSTKLPYKVGAVYKPEKMLTASTPTLIIRTHEEYLHEYFNGLRLIESVDDLLVVINVD